MSMSLRLGVVLGGILLLLGGLCIPAGAQRFPYEAPRAPEFDRRGNYVPPGTDNPEPVTRRQRARHEAPQAPRARRTSRPYHPEPPQPPSQPTRAAASPPSVQPQPQQMPDCSQYFSMMAGSRSQQELQWNARLYLTCLLKRGWRPEQAKQEVIRVIESLRASRR